MKKRFFAGLLACLMVVGLLPLSMLLKPVSAKAATGKTQIFDVNNYTLDKVGSANKEIKINDSFTIWSYSDTEIQACDKITWDDGYSATKKLWVGSSAKKDSKGISSCIQFNISGNATVKVWFSAASKDRVLGIYAEDDLKPKTPSFSYRIPEDELNKPLYKEFKIENKSEQPFYVGFNKNKTYIYKIEVVEESASKPVVEPTVKPVEKTSYSVVVNSSNGKKNETVEDGATIGLTTDTTNFLYWINSNGKIVSRKANDTITVYYEDEYTAVYEEEAVVKYMTAYGKVYKSVPVSQFNVNEKVAGPVRYGYNFTDWKTSASDIKKAIDNNEKVIIVEPGYESADKSFKVTIDTTALTNGIKENKTPKINEVVKASTDSSEFAYWVDDNNNVLSYNSTYYFFANRNINVKAVKKTADVSPKGVISLVDKGTNEVGDSVVIFEYTIPSTCTVKFAGVVASPTKDKLTRSTAEYVGGDAFSGSTTYRYTITKTKGMDTWYVLPVLEYVDGTQVKSVLWNTPVEF